MEKQKKGYKSLIIKLLVSVGLFSFIVANVDKQAFLANLKLMDFAFVPLIIVFIILNYIVSSYRWKSLLIFENTESADITYLTKLYFIGSYFNNFAPTSIGGDAYKVYKLGKRIKSTTHAFSATFMERFTGVLVLILISLVSLYKILGIWLLLISLWMLLGFYIGFYFLKRLSKKFKLVEKVYSSLSTYEKKYKVLGNAFITSIIVQLFSVFTQYTIFLSLGIKLPLEYALFTFPIITLASFFIPSLNGIGVQDLMYMSAFQFLGVPKEVSLSASILYHIFRLFVSLIGGVFYLTNKDS